MQHVVDGVPLDVPAAGTNLPPRAFTSAAVFDIEQRAIFARSWVHVCDAVDLPAPGSYVAATIGTTPVIVLRDPKTSELRAFLNACRHRGAKLVDGKGSCDKQIKCPYHAWSYGLDGRLIGVPYRDEFDDVSSLGLIPVRVGQVGPLVFACLDASAPALEDWVGELPAAFARSGLERWVMAFELSYELEANWKLFVENANDGYHVPIVHDILPDLLVLGSGFTRLEPHSAYSMADINPQYVPPDSGFVDPQIRFGSIFPNLIPVLTPSDLTYIRVDPIGPDRLRLFVRSYDAEESPIREFRKLAFQRTTDQDIVVVQRTMEGLRAHGLPAGVHARSFEERIGHFERLWASAMQTELVASSFVSSGMQPENARTHGLVRNR